VDGLSGTHGHVHDTWVVHDPIPPGWHDESIFRSGVTPQLLVGDGTKTLFDRDRVPVETVIKPSICGANARRSQTRDGAVGRHWRLTARCQHQGGTA